MLPVQLTVYAHKRVLPEDSSVALAIGPHGTKVTVQLPTALAIGQHGTKVTVQLPPYANPVTKVTAEASGVVIETRYAHGLFVKSSAGYRLAHGAPVFLAPGVQLEPTHVRRIGAMAFRVLSSQTGFKELTNTAPNTVYCEVTASPSLLVTALQERLPGELTVGLRADRASISISSAFNSSLSVVSTGGLAEFLRLERGGDDGELMGRMATTTINAPTVKHAFESLRRVVVTREFNLMCVIGDTWRVPIGVHPGQYDRMTLTAFIRRALESTPVAVNLDGDCVVLESAASISVVGAERESHASFAAPEHFAVHESTRVAVPILSNVGEMPKLGHQLRFDEARHTAVVVIGQTITAEGDQYQVPACADSVWRRLGGRQVVDTATLKTMTRVNFVAAAPYHLHILELTYHGTPLSFVTRDSDIELERPQKFL